MLASVLDLAQLVLCVSDDRPGVDLPIRSPRSRTDAGSSIQVGISLGAAAGGDTLVLLDIDHWN